MMDANGLIDSILMDAALWLELVQYQHVTKEMATSKAKGHMKEPYALLHKIQDNDEKIREIFIEDQAAYMADTSKVNKDKATIWQLISGERSY